MTNPTTNKTEFKMPLPKAMRDDLKTLAFLDGITAKGKVAMLIQAEIDARRADIDGVNARRK